MGNTKIEWTRNADGRPGKVWNPVVGCSHVSSGCTRCYAERITARFRKDHKPWTAANAVHNVVLHPERLEQPLHWRKPQRIFVNSMSDLFHEALPDNFIDQVFSVMARSQQHTFQILTKRPERMRHVVSELIGAASMLKGRLCGPLKNIWLGVSVEDQATADERIPLLLQTPAAVRFVSVEPMLGPVDLTSACGNTRDFLSGRDFELLGADNTPGLDWVILGAESGPKARRCNLVWIRSAVAQCKASAVKCYVKQLGKDPIFDRDETKIFIRHSKGGDPAEWPEDLRVREFPK